MSKLRELIDNYNRDNKRELITEGIKLVDYESISFSSPMLNYLLHGGFPRGRIVEFYGLESSGKTTTALDICGNAQKLFYKEFLDKKTELEAKLKDKANKNIQNEYNLLLDRGEQKVIYFDLEQTFDEEWAVKLGVDPEKIVLVRPDVDSGEHILELILDMLNSEEVGLVVIDSIPSLVSEAELEKSLSEQTRGGIAKLMGTFLKKALPILRRTKASLLLINQIRDSMNPYEAYTTPGGRAIKFYSSVRLLFKEGAYLDQNNKEIAKNSPHKYGEIINVRVEKTKICRPDRVLGYFTLNFMYGVDKVDDLISLLIDNGYIKQSGSFFSFFDENGESIVENEKEVKIQGRSNIKDYLKNNENLLNKYFDVINNIIKGD